MPRCIVFACRHTPRHAASGTCIVRRVESSRTKRHEKCHGVVPIGKRDTVRRDAASWILLSRQEEVSHLQRHARMSHVAARLYFRLVESSASHTIRTSEQQQSFLGNKLAYMCLKVLHCDGECIAVPDMTMDKKKPTRDDDDDDGNLYYYIRKYDSLAVARRSFGSQNFPHRA